MNKSQLKKRFIIGSANFSQKYGIKSTKVSEEEIKKILNLAKKNKIFTIDTASAYLHEKKIFKKINKKFKFSSKMIPDSRWVSLEYCQKQIENHFKILSLNKVETIFFHNSEILLSKHGSKIFENLKYFKKKKYFNKIGLSIYDTKILNFVVSNYDLDVVQCPYNILDKRILVTGWFDKLKKLGVEVHARSIFLQGLLVDKSLIKKKYFIKWYKQISDWFAYLEKCKISPINYCISDLLNTNFDKIIIGVNSLDNFSEIINFKKVNISEFSNLKINDLNLIDPRRWKHNEN